MLVDNSYAQGKGDWYNSLDQNLNNPFHSAHVIHEQTSIDVISFGTSGTGSLRGLVAESYSQQFKLFTFSQKIEFCCIFRQARNECSL